MSYQSILLKNILPMFNPIIPIVIIVVIFKELEAIFPFLENISSFGWRMAYRYLLSPTTMDVENWHDGTTMDTMQALNVFHSSGVINVPSYQWCIV
jgi:hypothetical protein